MLDSGDEDFVVARVTTQVQQTPFDVLLTDWQQAGLLASSVVRLHKVATLAKARVHRRLGQLQTADRQRVAAALPQLFSGW